MIQRPRFVSAALAFALCSAPLVPARAADAPALPDLIERLRPPAPRADIVSTAAAAVPRARPAATDEAAGTSAPDGAAAAALALPFHSGSATLTDEAETMLDALGRALTSAELSGYRFRIEGHTDTAGEAPVNLALSARRAAAVRAFLVSRSGVPSARLEAVGLGETRLLVPTPDGTPEPRNRRVQIVNLGG